MIDLVAHTPEWDAEVETLRKSRNSSALLKLRLAKLRSEITGISVLAFEGDDDAIVYCHWIRRLKPALEYEPFPCNGKEGVLQLMDVVSRDLSGELDPIYYFIDRDFDDWKGRLPSERAFMPDHYSVENYLVSAEVLDELLKSEFHCHGRPQTRRGVIGIFEADLQNFLSIATPLNERLFIAKRSGIRTTAPLTKKLSAVADVKLGNIKPGSKDVLEIVGLEREPSAEEIALQKPFFAALAPLERHRGKYILSFFDRWLRLLCHELNNPMLGLFAGIDSVSNARQDELTMGNYAARGLYPKGLEEFLATVN